MSPDEPVGGTLEWADANVVAWYDQGGVVTGPYRYDIVAFGDVDPAGGRPAITTGDGKRLDGEPTALPSGDRK